MESSGKGDALMSRPRASVLDRAATIQGAGEVVGIVANLLRAVAGTGEAMPAEAEWLAGHLEQAHVAIVEALQ